MSDLAHRWQVFASVALLLFVLLSCRDPGQQAIVEAIESAPITPLATPIPLTDAEVQPLVLLICSLYARWPRSLLDEPWQDQTAAVLEGFSSRQLATVEGNRLTNRVVSFCPETVPAGSLSPDGCLPRPEPVLSEVPGLFPPSESNSSERDRTRFEWTAVGLGCLGLSDGEDRDLAELEETFLGQMGYSLESYVTTALEMQDPEMSERIFQRIVICARRFGAEPVE